MAAMDAEHARDRLEEERERLGGLRAGLDVDDMRSESEQTVLEESTQSQHQADIGTETFDRERDLSMLESIEAELLDVEHALRRIDDGSYGTCEACGRPIGDARLEAVPAARFCLDDQHLAESESGRSRAE
jgi:RNA polymerase-binding transcription factor DksA